MGIIQRQGIKFGLISYVGIVIGALSQFFIYSQDLEIYGLAQFLLNTGAFIAPFILIGIQWLPVKFMPHLKNKTNGNEGFLTLLVVLLFVCISIFTLGYYYFYDYVYEIFAKKDKPLLNTFIPYALPFGIIISINVLFNYFITSFERIVVPNLLTNLFLKITLPILVFLTIGQYLNYIQFVKGLLVTQLIITLGLIIYLYILGELKFRKINWEKISPLKKEMTSYSLIGLLAGLGSIFAFRIDILMIGNYIDLRSAGAYSMAIFIANAIAIPTASIVRIAGVVISKSWKDNDMNEIQKIYKAASLNLFLVGTLLYILVMASLEDLVSLMPTTEDLSLLYPITGLIGLAKLFDMLTSTNTEIIMFSKRYKFNMYATLVLGLLNVIMNYAFIVTLDWGLLGAALATTISIALFNLMKLIFIQWQFKMHPFSVGLIYILILGVICFGVVYYLVPMTSMSLVNIIIKSGLIGLSYLFVSYKFKLSPQINRVVDGFVGRFL